MAAVSHMAKVSDSLCFCTGHNPNQRSLFSHVQVSPLKGEAINDLRYNSQGMWMGVIGTHEVG